MTSAIQNPFQRHFLRPVTILLCALWLGCPPEDSGGNGGDSTGSGDWPGEANAYSWDGSWAPTPDELPPDGLLDDIYFDAHVVGSAPSPILPPGAWDWIGGNGSVSELANWNSFNTRVGTFAPLIGEGALQYGWRLLGNTPNAVYLDYRSDPFDGSSGVDLLDLGPGGEITMTGDLNLADGPDMIRYRYCSAADIRTGSSETGAIHDNDLVIAGSEAALAAGEYDVRTSTVHTGPGNDLVFINNIQRAAVDLGNGAHGRTDTLDSLDGDDMVVIGGNCYDFRIFGGEGNDTIIWKVDETNQNTPWIGANFFGAGGWEPAAWDDGLDRIVLDVPIETPVLEGPTGTIQPGTVAVWLLGGYNRTPVPDPPTENDVFARYYGTAGIGPGDKKTLMLEYESTSRHVHTGWCGITGIEELQVGVGPGAKVYRIDEVNGGATFDPALAPITAIPARSHYRDLLETWAE